MQPVSLKQLWKEAFLLSFQNYLIFLPMLISLLFGLFSLPFYNEIYVLSTGQFSFSALLSIIPLSIASTVVGILMYGWTFSLTRQLVLKQRVSLPSSGQEILPFSWKLFKTFLLVLLLMITVFVALGILFVLTSILAFIPVIGILFAVILGIATILLFFLFVVCLLEITPILIMEDLGAWQSINKGINNTFRFFNMSARKALLALLLYLIANIPYFIFMFGVGQENMLQYMVSHPFLHFLYTSILSLPMLVITVVIIVFYSLYHHHTQKRTKTPKRFNKTKHF